MGGPLVRPLSGFRSVTRQISSWFRRSDDLDVRLLKLREPVNKFPDFIKCVVTAILWACIHSKFDIRRMFGTMVYTMLLLFVGIIGCRHNAWHERLWIEIIERKPGALNLHHEAMPGQDCVIYMG